MKRRSQHSNTKNSNGQLMALPESESDLAVVASEKPQNSSSDSTIKPFFFFFILMISIGRLCYFIMDIVVRSTAKQRKDDPNKYQVMNGVINFFSIAPGLLFINIFFMLLLSWARKYHLIRYYFESSLSDKDIFITSPMKKNRSRRKSNQNGANGHNYSHVKQSNESLRNGNDDDNDDDDDLFRETDSPTFENDHHSNNPHFYQQQHSSVSSSSSNNNNNNSIYYTPSMTNGIVAVSYGNGEQHPYQSTMTTTGVGLLTPDMLSQQKQQQQQHGTTLSSPMYLPNGRNQALVQNHHGGGDHEQQSQYYIYSRTDAESDESSSNSAVSNSINRTSEQSMLLPNNNSSSSNRKSSSSNNNNSRKKKQMTTGIVIPNEVHRKKSIQNPKRKTLRLSSGDRFALSIVRGYFFICQVLILLLTCLAVVSSVLEALDEQKYHLATPKTIVMDVIFGAMVLITFTTWVLFMTYSLLFVALVRRMTNHSAFQFFSSDVYGGESRTQHKLIMKTVTKVTLVTVMCTFVLLAKVCLYVMQMIFWIADDRIAWLSWLFSPPAFIFTLMGYYLFLEVIPLFILVAITFIKPKQSPTRQ